MGLSWKVDTLFGFLRQKLLKEDSERSNATWGVLGIASCKKSTIWWKIAFSWNCRISAFSYFSRLSQHETFSSFYHHQYTDQKRAIVVRLFHALGFWYSGTFLSQEQKANEQITNDCRCRQILTTTVDRVMTYRHTMLKWRVCVCFSRWKPWLYNLCHNVRK